MKNRSLQAEELGEMARQFLREADANFLLNEYLSGSQRMWDAAAHAVKAACQHRNWPHHSRQDLDLSVTRLAGELRTVGREADALCIDAGYLMACNSHINFYHRDMDLDGGNGWYFATARKAVHRFVEIVVSMSESSEN